MQNEKQVGRPVLLGVPFDANSSYLRGAAEAPAEIRRALRSDSSNWWAETGVDLGTSGVFGDGGDVDLGDEKNLQPQGAQGNTGESERVFAAIESRVGELMDQGLRPVCLGGDHSVTYPIVRAFAQRNPKLTIIHFDAHPDLYDEFEGNRYSHACPFARIMEEGAAKRLIQVGIRTINGHQREQAQKFGVEVIEMRGLPALARMRVDGAIYISFDMDAIDPGAAPGVSHREPGGMSVREAIAHIHAISGDIVGADVVEFNPAQDTTGLTSMVAAKVVKEILGRMIQRG